MQEYCVKFKCKARDLCVDEGNDCSEMQCQFLYDCESCEYHNNCECEE